MPSHDPRGRGTDCDYSVTLTPTTAEGDQLHIRVSRVTGRVKWNSKKAMGPAHYRSSGGLLERKMKAILHGTLELPPDAFLVDF